MAFTPATIIHFLSVPIDATQKHQLYFADRTAQETYMSTKVIRTFNDLRYQRKDNFIIVPMHVDQLYDCNYVMYQNTAIPGRWFYAFITRMDYVNDGVTNVYIETDVYQTWYLDCEILPSYVEREHEEGVEV